MKLSRQVEQAVTLLSELARKHGRVKMAELTAHTQVNQKAGEIIMHQLCIAGLVSVKRGRRGGYVLNQAPSSITMLKVFEAVDGPLFPVPSDAAESVRYVAMNIKALVQNVVEQMTLDVVSAA